MVAVDKEACWGFCLCVYNFLIRFQAQSTWWHFNLMEKAIFGFKLEQPCQIHLVLVWPFLISIIVLHFFFFNMISSTTQTSARPHLELTKCIFLSFLIENDPRLQLRSHYVGGLLSSTSQAQGWFKLVWVNSNWKWCTTAAAAIILCWCLSPGRGDP